MIDPPVVIYNPKAGRGLAARSAATWKQRLPAGAEVLTTTRPGEARELAANALRNAARWLVAAGGDGTAHEVVNAILESGVSDGVFTPLPLGSANDYASALGLVEWWEDRRAWHDLKPMLVDAVNVRSGTRTSWFANCCGIGFNGMVTIEARKIAWLRGIPLYATAILKSLWRHYDAPMMHFTLDDVNWQAPTLACTIGVGQREGGFPLTAAARLDDGLFDLLHVGPLKRLMFIRHFPGMISGRLPTHPLLRVQRGNRLTVQSERPLCVHLDGEFFCTPSENIRELTLQLKPGALIVSSYPPGMPN